MIGRKAAMPFIMITVLIDMITVGLIIPVLPRWVGAFTTTAQANAFWYGVIVFTFGFANFFAAPILGVLSDRYGRRPILLVGIFGVAMSLLLTGLSTAMWMLVLARLIGGTLQANLAVANAYVADIAKPEQLTNQFGLLGAMMGLGFVLGPALGGIAGRVDIRLPFFIAATLAAINWLYGYFLLPESITAERRQAFAWRRASAFSSVSKMLSFGRSRLLLLAICANALAQLTFTIAWVLYTQYRFNWGPRESGLSMFGLGLMAMIVQGGLVGALRRRMSLRSITLLAMLAATIGYSLLGFVQATWQIYPIMFFYAFGFASVAAIQSEIVRSGDGTDQGRVFGALASVNALAAMLAPIVSSGALTYVAGLARFQWQMGAPMFVCAAVEVGALTAAMVYFKDPQAVKRAIRSGNS
jgi:MFS transporter, DHA1 family, tetracycline resistance protein